MLVYVMPVILMSKLKAVMLLSMDSETGSVNVACITSLRARILVFLVSRQA